MNKQIFVNVPVKDLEKSKAFFTAVGYTFDPRFTSENGVCVVIGDNIFAMLLVESFFKTFLGEKNICDAKKEKEVLIALAVGSREEVDEIMKKALSAGGSEEPREMQGSEWMYGRALQDLDGHIWEYFFMDEEKMPEEMKSRGSIRT